MKSFSRILTGTFAFLICVGLGACASGQASSAASVSEGGSSASRASQVADSASASESPSAADASLAPGTYFVSVDTGSSMFHVNEADEGKGELAVAQDGSMTLHIRLASKKIVNLYAGTAEQAEADADNLIQPTTETVTYSDGYEEEVYGFDIPVPAIGQGFDVAILGSKGNWYTHEVTVTDPVSIQ